MTRKDSISQHPIRKQDPPTPPGVVLPPAQELAGEGDYIPNSAPQENPANQTIPKNIPSGNDVHTSVAHRRAWQTARQRAAHIPLTRYTHLPRRVALRINPQKDYRDYALAMWLIGLPEGFASQVIREVFYVHLDLCKREKKHG